jgi:predicted kinase
VSEAFPPCPQPPHWELDWSVYDARYPWIRDLRGCRQDPVRHAEGDVWTHVSLVTAAMAAMPAWRDRPERERKILFTAALLHDVAKPATTRTDAAGNLSSRGHSWRGAIMARRILWRLGVPFAEREQIAALVRHHLVPLYLWEREDPSRLAIEVSQTARCDHLAILAEADARGRICPDPQRLLDNIGLFTRCCIDAGCLSAPYSFPSELERFVFFHTNGKPLPQPNAGLEVVLLSGLPGSGKDHWIQRNMNGDRPIISIDQIRQDLGISPTEPQGPVLAHARELARTHLRNKQSFVWNATNLSRQVRAECVKLYTEFGASVRIVYLEVPPDRLFAQNRQRRNRVPQSVIERLLDRWEVPDPTEAHRIDWIVET